MEDTGGEQLCDGVAISYSFVDHSFLFILFLLVFSVALIRS